MFKLPKIVAWRFNDPSGMSCILTTAQAEARFRHEDMYGAHRIRGLHPVIAKEKAPAEDRPGLVVAFGAD